MSSIYKKHKGIPDFIVLLFIVSLLLIDFFPYFKSMEIIHPQFLYLSVLNLLIGVYFYFNSEFIAESIIPILKKSYILKIYAIFLFLCGLSFITAKNTSLVLTKLTEIIIVFCLFINLSILLKNKLHLLYKIIFIVGLSAFVQSWQQLSSFIIIPRNASIIQLLSDMKGNTGNINILAASLTIKIPFLLLGITHFNNYKKWILLLTLFTVTAVIFLTGARTALVNLFLIFLVYILYLFRENSFYRPTFIKVLFIIIPVLIASLYSNTIFEKSKDTPRYVSVENRISQISTDDTSSQARLTFWNNILKISKKSPVFGIGLGNYQIESIPYERLTANDSNASLHAHNDFLEILAETGILNGCVYLSLFIVVFFINIKRVLKATDFEVKTIACLTLLLLIVYEVDSFFNFPMYRPTMQIFLALLLALTVVNNSKTSDEVPDVISKKDLKLYPVLIVIALLTTYSAFLINKASRLEFLIVADDINTNKKGFLTGDEIIKRMPKYPNVLGTSESFYEYAGIYYIREKQYDKALKSFSHASKINPYFGRIDFYKYLISKEKRNLDSAYVYIKKAFYLRPRNLDIYQTSAHLAAFKKDTTEILKEHAIVWQYRKDPQAWTIAATELQNAGFSRKKLVQFIDIGVKEMPNDSTLLKQKNTFLITNYIIEGQNFIDKSNPAKALETYQKALKIDPTNIYVMQNIGFYYYGLNQYPKAITYFKNALKHPGLNNGKTEFFISLCYMKTNDKENVCKYLLLARDKNYPGAQVVYDKYCQ